MSLRELQLSRQAVDCLRDITALLAEPNNEALKAALLATEKLMLILPEYQKAHQESVENQSG